MADVYIDHDRADRDVWTYSLLLERNESVLEYSSTSKTFFRRAIATMKGSFLSKR